MDISRYLRDNFFTWPGGTKPIGTDPKRSQKSKPIGTAPKRSQKSTTWKLNLTFDFSQLGLYQRWSTRERSWPQGRPRGHILKPLASKPQVLGLEASSPRKLPCPPPRTALFFKA